MPSNGAALKSYQQPLKPEVAAPAPSPGPPRIPIWAGTGIEPGHPPVTVPEPMVLAPRALRSGIATPGLVAPPPVQIASPPPPAAFNPVSVPELTRPVTENPVVGGFVRAMDKSGVPIAERPNLLLKGSGRVNRILGPEEDLTDSLTKSLRQARRQREQ